MRQVQSFMFSSHVICLPMMALLLVHNRINIAVFKSVSIFFNVFSWFYPWSITGWEIWFNISSRGVFWRTSWKSWLMDGKLSCVHFFRWQETIWAQISLHTTEHQPNNSFAQIWTMHIYILLHVWKKKSCDIISQQFFLSVSHGWTIGIRDMGGNAIVVLRWFWR